MPDREELRRKTSPEFVGSWTTIDKVDLTLLLDTLDRYEEALRVIDGPCQIYARNEQSCIAAPIKHKPCDHCIARAALEPHPTPTSPANPR